MTTVVPDQASLLKRANRVGMRTLRHRPKVVDQTRAGEPVFEVGSVRMVLRENATHFNRLVACARCDREAPGSSVRTAADLESPAQSVICADCVRYAALAPGQVGRGAPEPTLQRPPDASPAPLQPVSSDNGRLAALEGGLRAVVSRLADVSEDHDRLSSGASTESELAGGAELVPVAQALTEMRSEMLRVEESHRRIAEAQAELERHFADMVQQMASLSAQFEEADGRLAAARQESEPSALQSRAEAIEASVLEQVIARIAESQGQGLEALRSELQVGITDQLAELRRSMSVTGSDPFSRIKRLERAVAARDSDVADLCAVQDALDSGMGQLRDELAALRTSIEALRTPARETTKKAARPKN